MSKRWSQAERSILQEGYARLGAVRLGHLLPGRNYDAITKYAGKLGLRQIHPSRPATPGASARRKWSSGTKAPGVTHDLPQVEFVPYVPPAPLPRRLGSDDYHSLPSLEYRPERTNDPALERGPAQGL